MNYIVSYIETFTDYIPLMKWINSNLETFITFSVDDRKKIHSIVQALRKKFYTEHSTLEANLIIGKEIYGINTDVFINEALIILDAILKKKQNKTKYYEHLNKLIEI